MGTRVNLYRYVKKCGGRYQARLWLGYDRGHLNLGYYPSEREAWLAARDYLRSGKLPAGLLPRYVHRLRAGRYKAWVKICGTVLRTPPAETPEEAHRAITRLIRSAHPEWRFPYRKGRFRPVHAAGQDGGRARQVACCT